MNNELNNIYKRLANEQGKSVKQIKKEMQQAIDFAYKSNGKRSDFQNSIQRKGDIPTPDEMIIFLANKINNEKNR